MSSYSYTIKDLTDRVQQYHKLLHNTQHYRKIWEASLKNQLIRWLDEVIKDVGLPAEIEEAETPYANLHGIMVSLGFERTDIAQIIDDEVRKPLYKFKGALGYYQVFNGKIKTVIHMPAIEEIQKPLPDKLLSIYRPDEFNKDLIVEHLVRFMDEICQYEDFDDEERPPSIGFHPAQRRKK